MLIKGLQNLSLIDYPGQVACTIFTFGCNFRCPYCHNPELIEDDGRPAVSEDELFRFLKERKGFLDAVCITGGEPTLHEDLPDWISRIRDLGFLVKLDTNGTNPQMLQKLIDRRIVNYISMDVKAPPERYQEIVKADVDIDKIKRSIMIIRNSGIDYEFRTTVFPELDEKDFLEIAKWLKGSRRYFLQQFRRKKMLDMGYEKKPYSDEKLNHICEKIKGFFGECSIRGLNS